MTHYILQKRSESELPRCPISGKASFGSRDEGMAWIRRLKHRYNCLSDEERYDWEDQFPWGLPQNVYKCDICFKFHSTVSTGPAGRRMQRGHSKKRNGRHR